MADEAKPTSLEAVMREIKRLRDRMRDLEYAVGDIGRIVREIQRTVNQL